MALLFITLVLLSSVGELKAKEFPFSYFVKTSYSMFTHNATETVYDVTESECGETCLYSVAFECLAFDFNFAEFICLLSRRSSPSDIETNKDVNHFERLKGTCSNPALGLEEGAILLDDMSMSSYLGGNEDGPLGISKDHVRLNSDGGWCAKEQDDINNITEWVQINFNEMKEFGGFVTQGFNHPDLDPIYCSQFKISYSNSSSLIWTMYEENGNEVLFNGNTDQNTAVVNMFAQPFRANQIRVHPTVCYNHPCLRLELYGCPVDCEPNPCMENATCTDDSTDLWNVTCDCPPGYVADFCQVDFDECASNPCQNGATCVDHVDYYTCDCVSGWEAYDCQNETDECLSNPCQNGATCTDLLDGYNCTCIDGFEGTHCENFTVECSDGFLEGVYTCYQVVFEAVNATNVSLAQEACADIRGHLFYPSDYWEQNHLSTELHAMNFSSSVAFFIGLQWDGSNVTFDDNEGSPDMATWYDSSNTAVNPWAGGYPTGTADCVAMVMDGAHWKWRNIDCDTQLGYICQQDRINGNFSQWSPWSKCSVTCGPGEGIQTRTRTCTDPAPLLGGQECEGNLTQTQVCGEICPIVDCPEGFVTRYDTCYLLRTNETASYAEAKADCENLTEVYGSHLLFMNDKSEEVFVSQMLFDFSVNQSLAYYTGNLFLSSVYFDWIYATGEPNMTSWEWLTESPWGSNVVVTPGSPTVGWTTSDALDSVGLTSSGTTPGVMIVGGSTLGVVTTDGGLIRMAGGSTVSSDGTVTNGAVTAESAIPGIATTGMNGVGATTADGAIGGMAATTSDGGTPDGTPGGINSRTAAVDGATSGLPTAGVTFSPTGVALPGVTTISPVTTDMTTPGVTTPGVTTAGVTSPGVTTPGLTTAGLTTADASSQVVNCIVLRMDGTLWKWYLESCNYTGGYICEVNIGGGEPGPWSAWSECSSACGTGNRTRSRECDSPAPILGGENCTLPLTDNITCDAKCPEVTCPEDMVVYRESCFRLVTDGRDYAGAIEECRTLTNGSGYLARFQTYDELEFNSHRNEEQGLSRRDRVFVDMSYNSSGIFYENGTKQVNLSAWGDAGPWANGYPSQSMEPCMALVFDKHQWRWLMSDVSCTDTASYICEISRSPGSWGSWSGWTQCGPDCENGTQTRYRACDDPPPYLGGEECPGNANQTRNCSFLCSKVLCPDGFEVFYDSCYKHVEGPETRASANETCLMVTNGTGHLTYISSHEEQHSVSWLIENSGTARDQVVYVGLDYLGNTLRYLESENGPAAADWGGEDQWARGYPVNGGDSCIGMAYDARSFEWKFADVACDESTSFVCEITQTDGNWGPWGPWSSCSVTCSEGLQQRQRSCNDPAPILDGAPCPGNDSDVRVCSDPCPIVNCSDGYHTRYDSCYLFGPANQSQMQSFSEANETCYLETNGTGHLAFISDWAELQAVNWRLILNNFLETVWLYIGHVASDLSFVDGSGSANLTTWNGTNGPWGGPFPMFDDPAATCVALRYSPRKWEWLMANTNCDSTMSYICEITQTDGNWASWTPWSQCTISCDIAPDMGTQLRNRSCTNPAPILGGAYCPGNSTEVQACGDQCPPVHGNYTEWEYGECSVSCYSWDSNGTRYGGLVNRTRNCTNPAPRFYGNDCVGEPWEIVSCGTEDGNDCPPINGSYSGWSNFSECSTTCGGGIRNRTRKCDSPPPQHGGADCAEPPVEYQNCSTDPCPIDGGLTPWSNWMECTVSCGGGTQYRNRSCTNPSPAYGGFNCSDPMEQVRNCSENIKCPIHGNYTEWTSWSNCSIECGGNGTTYRTRNCSNPTPRYNGDDCQGHDVEYETCGTHPCPINGGVGSWGYWTPCSVDCGHDGVSFCYRPCNNPTPEHGGDDCDLDSMYLRRTCSAAVNCSASSGNVATSGSARQSSMTADGRARRAVDGGTSSSWNNGSCILTEKEPYPWWQLDLGEFSHVDTVTVYPRECMCYYCYFQLVPYVVRVGPSDKPEENRRCDDVVDSQSANEGPHTVSCGIVGRYVSVQLWMDQMSLSLAEVEVTVYSDVTAGLDGPALGMGSLGIKDDQMSASSRREDSKYSPQGARIGQLDNSAGWMPASNDSDPWIMVDFAGPVTLKGIATQGIPCCGSFVTGYYLSFSSDGASWWQYMGDRPKWKLVQANMDSSSIVRHSLDDVSGVRYVRLEPKTWNNSVALRLEFYGVHEPVNGQYSSSWSEWGQCSVACEDLGIRKRSLACEQGDNIKCMQNPQKKWFVDPLLYFKASSNATLDSNDSVVYNDVATAGNCSLLCLDETQIVCVSFEYSSARNCTLFGQGALANNLTLVEKNGSLYYELFYASCNMHYAVAKYRGQDPGDGVYRIWVNDGQEELDVYCDMTRDGGGWTLLVTSATNSGWSAVNVVSRAVSSPSLYSDYSILSYGNDIRDLTVTDTFKYRIEAFERGSWGGIYEVPKAYTFVKQDNSQTASLITRFGSWLVGNTSFQHIMPWLTSHTPALLSTHEGTSEEDYIFFGTLVCACMDYVWTPLTSYLTVYFPNETVTMPAPSTTTVQTTTHLTTTTPATTTTQATTTLLPTTTTPATSAAPNTNASNTNLTDSNTTLPASVNTTSATTTTVPTTTLFAPLTTKPSTSTITYGTTDAPIYSSDVDTSKMIWYWVREDRYEFEPSLEWDLSGRCRYDTDLPDCNEACLDMTVPAKSGGYEGVAASQLSLVKARQGSAYRCSVYLSGNYINLGNFSESCLRDLSYCTQGFTASLWAKINSTDNLGSGYKRLLSTSTFSINYQDGSSTPTLTVAVFDDSQWRVQTTDFPDGEWFHIAFTFDGSLLAVYVNGALKGSDDSAGTVSEINLGDDPGFILGSQVQSPEVSASQISAAMADLKVFFRTFQEQRMLLLYAESNQGEQGELCGTWPCPIHGGFSSWWVEISCSVTCGDYGTEYQLRSCTNPVPQYSGDDCSGVSKKWVGCSAGDSCNDNEDTPLGMEDGSIPDSSLSASSCSNNTENCSLYSRLNSNNETLCWMPEFQSSFEWLQIDFADSITLKAVGTTGHVDSPDYVTSYSIAYSTNGTNWAYYRELGQKVGNFDNSTLVRNTLVLDQAVNHVRFYPESWINGICMRVELYGYYNPVDGNWGSWGPWQDCSETCGRGVQQRSRNCSDPAPRHLGSYCPGSSDDSQACNEQPCPIDGGFGSWYAAGYNNGDCTVTCGEDGIFQQARDCDSPPTQYGGANCSGITERWQDCVSVTCNADEDTALGVADGTIPDSQLSESNCSTSGDYCASWGRLDDSDTTKCWMPDVTDDNQWLQIYLVDTVTLLSVAIQGRPSDNNYVTSYQLSLSENGTYWYDYVEDGNIKIFQGCIDNTNAVRSSVSDEFNVRYVRIHPLSWSNDTICMRAEVYGSFNPIHGAVGPWGNWSECSVTCGGGTQTRSRSCDNPAPKYNGESCSDSLSDSQICNDFPCPIDGGFGSWYDVTACTTECGSYGTVMQERDCDNPTPQYGGANCTGIDQQWVSCDSASACAVADNYALGMEDGTITDSLLSCSEGTGSNYGATSARLGDSDQDDAWAPATSDTGDYLEIQLPDTITLERVAVEGRLESDGTENYVTGFYVLHSMNGTNWTYVEKDGLIGPFRGNFDATTVVVNSIDAVYEANYVRFVPDTWENSIGMRVELYGIYNPIHGAWSQWSPWSTCSVTCGGSQQTRTRTCTNPSPKYFGDSCPAADADSETRDCGTRPCPIDGDWTPWTAWNELPCSISCGQQGLRHRTRTCTNPPPQYNGSYCSDPELVEQFNTCDSNTNCGECYEALGLYDYRIKNWQLNATSYHNDSANQAEDARLNVAAESGKLCWEAAHENVTNGTTQHLQIDLVTPITLSMVGVQGGKLVSKWITWYNLSYTLDGQTWSMYEENGEVKTFLGNIDETGVVKTTLDTPIDGVVGVRFIPVEWEGERICLRVELYGCFTPSACTTNSQLTISSSTEVTPSDGPSFVLVELQSFSKVTLVRTNSDGSKWMEGYYLAFRQNLKDLAYYRDNDTVKEFLGNYERDLYVTNVLLNPINIRYLLVYPTSTNNGISSDVTLFGCAAELPVDPGPSSSVCFDSYQLSNSIFSSSQITVTSVLPSSDGSSYYPEYARLLNPSDPKYGLNGWVSEEGSVTNSAEEYMQIDFEKRVTVTGLALQGVETPFGNKTLSEFSLWFSEDDIQWYPMKQQGSDNITILTGTTDADTVIRVELTQEGEVDMRPLTLRYLRIKSEVTTNDSVGLRLELYGCDAAVDTICPDGWANYEYSCYKVERNLTKTYLEAQAHCASQAYGGHLSAVTTEGEHNFLREFVRYYRDVFYFIGLDRRDMFSNLVWQDGQLLDYSGWASGYPTDSKFERCVALATREDGLWTTVSCDKSFHFVCEYQRDITDDVQCQENTFRASCPTGQVINVTYADLGRSEGWDVCPQELVFSYGDLLCSHSQSLEIVQSACDGNNECEIVVDFDDLGYPCSASGMNLYLNVSYTCEETYQFVRVCEGDFLELSCPGEDDVLHIQHAMCGRLLDGFVCPNPSGMIVTNCSLNSSLEVVQTFCEGYHECKLPVEVASFGEDPCDGVFKYLDVDYKCVSGLPVITDEYVYRGECEEGWVKHDLRCIKAFPDEQLKFEDADDKCSRLHGHLAGIPGDHTQQFLEGLLDVHGNTSFWIGCVQTKNNTCRWRDGIGHIYTKYNAEFVSEGGVRCIELSTEHNFHWDRARCIQENSFICQQDCMLTFGLSDMTIDNDQLEVSSTKLVASLDSFKWNARLNTPYGAWIASDRDTEQFFQVDFLRVMRIRKLATQGHPKYDFWITKYRLDYSVNDTVNGSTWNTYEEDGLEKVFTGNNDSNSVHLQYLKHFMFARFIRLVPLEWNEEISLRLEVYGCYLQDNKPEVLEVTNITKLHYNYNGTIQCRAFGTPLPTLRWERDGYVYEGNENATIVTYQEDDHHVVTEVHFHPMFDDRGFYTCVAENQFGTDRKSFYNEKGLYTRLGGRITCDDEILIMGCPYGEYIKVETTFYGRLHNERCIIYDDHYPTNCEYNPDVVRYRIEEQCNNKQHCMVYVSEIMFKVAGDNYTDCNGFPLYANTTYSCVGYEWTSWFNTDSPDDGQDEESRRAIFLSESSMCLDPHDIECRQASNGASYIDGGQVLDRPCTLHGEGGLVCKQSSQPGSASCLDYEVRFSCPEEDFGVYEFERAVECDGEELSISCKNDYSILVHRAFYGRREEGLCTLGNNHTYSSYCGLDDDLVLDMVKKNCDHKQNCKMNVQLATVLSDPCPGEYKYLDIHFSCERYRQNFARFKPSNTSSLAAPSFYSGLANDFSYSSDCNAGHCSETNAEFEPWWMVDLEAVYDINVVTVYTCEDEGQAASLDNFEVRIGNSSDLFANELCGSAVVDALPGANVVFCNQSLSGQFVSVHIPQQLTSLKVCEVDVQFLPQQAVKARSCDSQVLHLSCALYEVGYITVENAFYGRRSDGTLCPHNDTSHTYDQTCSASSSSIIDLVESLCKDRRNCEVDVERDILAALKGSGEGDPCPGEYKYLEVKYTCNKFISGNRTYESSTQVCKEEDLQIACFGENRFIEVVSAEYKPSTSDAPHWCPNEASQDLGACSAQDVLSPVQNLCNNKITCTVKADEYFLGATSCTTQKMQLEVNYNCKDNLPTGELTLYTCEGLDAELSLTCPDGEYINVTDAFYGRTQVGSSSLVCPDQDGQDVTTSCRSTDTAAVVMAYCQDQRSCSLPVDQAQLTATDPCPSIGSKYLQVSYRCEVGRPKEDITLYACEDHDDLYLECPDSFPHIRIIEANYGRLEGPPRCTFRENLPSFAQFTECRTDNVLDKIRDTCTNLQDCTVPSHWNGYINSEPCIGTYKYLQVTYRCLMTPAIFRPKGDFTFFINPYPKLKNYRLNSHILSTSKERNFLECVNRCLDNDLCASFNFNTVRTSQGFTCQLNDMIADEVPQEYQFASDFEYYERESFRVR